MARWFLRLVPLSLALTAQAGEPRVVCLGDSITKGVHLPEGQTYPAVLGRLLAGAEVINAGIGGNTSAQGLARLDRDVLSHRPQGVILLFGTNDSVLTAPGKYRVPVEQFQQNLRTMAQRCRRQDAAVVLCTLPAIDPEPYFSRHPKPYYDAEGGLEEIVGRYRAAALQLAREMDIPVVDLYDLFSNDKSLLRPPPDGVHPTASGCRLIAEQVAARLKPMLQLRKEEVR